MNDDAFGTLTFDEGWSKWENIHLWGKDYEVLVTAAAYYPHESVTHEQRAAYSEFANGKRCLLQNVETLLAGYTKEPQKRLRPRYLVFEKNGEYALLLDDSNDPDDGIAVMLSPERRVMSQDAYL